MEEEEGDESCKIVFENLSQTLFGVDGNLNSKSIECGRKLHAEVLPSLSVTSEMRDEILTANMVEDMSSSPNIEIIEYFTEDEMMDVGANVEVITIPESEIFPILKAATTTMRSKKVNMEKTEQDHQRRIRIEKLKTKQKQRFLEARDRTWEKQVDLKMKQEFREKQKELKDAITAKTAKNYKMVHHKITLRKYLLTTEKEIKKKEEVTEGYIGLLAELDVHYPLPMDSMETETAQLTLTS